jgi:hypothetical protein
MKRLLRPLALITALAAHVCFADEASESQFESLFNGKDLTGWEGDSKFWRVEDGVLIGQTTEDNKAEKNTFLILKGKNYGDFELRFRYKVEAFNSGIQYRSTDEGGM